mmetsp:Transcript_6103/g.17485  ORF Transcript_6103/g.17485 Transcript_6103/m.17485 type:complete len:128 (-) Transcript_6103:1416-1799(-)
MFAGDLTCSDLIQAYTQRIEAYDQATGMNAIQEVMPDALDIAAQKDRPGNLTDLPSLFCGPCWRRPTMTRWVWRPQTELLRLSTTFPPTTHNRSEHSKMQGASFWPRPTWRSGRIPALSASAAPTAS